MWRACRREVGLRIVTCCVAGAVGATPAADLVHIYQDALRSDPQIREAEATREAVKEASPQAWAALMPQVNGSYQASRQDSFSTQAQLALLPSHLQAIPYNSGTFVDAHGYQLSLQQSVFSWAKWSTVRQAHKRAAQAEADYHSAQQGLIQRVAQAYFNTLGAQDTLEAHLAAAAAIKRQLEQATERFAAALVTIADVKEAQAASDSAEATVIEDKRNLAAQEEALRRITGQRYADLAKPGDDMPLITPQPADPQAWVATAMDQNLPLLSARLGADIARDTVSIAIGGHLPTIDVVASRTQLSEKADETLEAANAGGRIHYPATVADKQIAIQISIPLFSGGATESQVRQSQYQWIAAKERVADLSRETEYQTLDAYSGIVSEVTRVKALRKGVDSAQAALDATEAGYEVNIRTAVEVLQQRQALAQAQTNYAQARYAYVLDVVQLCAASGTLEVATLQEINSWLTVAAGERYEKNTAAALP